MQYPTFQKKLNKRDGEENKACIERNMNRKRKKEKKIVKSHSIP